MPNGQIQKTEKPTTAFILSLLAGLWMLSVGGMMGGFGFGGMMAGQYRMARFRGMGNWMWGSGMHAFGTTWPWFGVAAGILVLIGSVMLYLRPQERWGWGLAILIISGVDFFVGMGGFLAGTLGVIGGALAMAGKP